MNIKIDKDVPIPAITHSGRLMKYPFELMEVRDSFYHEADLVAGTAEPSEETIRLMVKRLHSAAYCWARHNKNGKLFVVRGDSMGARIWRIK